MFLEERDVPATLTWIGGHGGNVWSNAANWKDQDNNNVVPTWTDTLVFNESATTKSIADMDFVDSKGVQHAQTKLVMTKEFGKSVSINSATGLKVESFQQDSGSITGPKTLTIVGDYLWNDGTIEGAIETAPTSSTRIHDVDITAPVVNKMNGGTFHNYGKVWISAEGGMSLENQGYFFNGAGAEVQIFPLVGNADIRGGSVKDVFHNAVGAKIVAQLGEYHITAALWNAGTVTVADSGTLFIDNSPHTEGGTFIVSDAQSKLVFQDFGTYSFRNASIGGLGLCHLEIG
jgi:hypothetical protein